MQYENMIGLIGTLKQIEKIDEVNGLSFNGYKAIVTTERTSGAKDDAIVLITEETMRDNRTGLPKEGEAVMIAGSVQTHKNFGTGKVLVYALAAVMEIMTGTHWQYENEIKFTGKLGKGINYRATPNGRKITDVFVKLPCDLNNTISCYVPCVCWGKDAKKVAGWNEGDQITATGRLQRSLGDSGKTYSRTLCLLLKMWTAKKAQSLYFCYLKKSLRKRQHRTHIIRKKSIE